MQKTGWKQRRGLLLAVCCSLLFFTLPLKADEFSQTAHYRVRLFSFGTFTMDVRTGDIYITAWDDPHVEIEAEKVVQAKSREGANHRYKRIRAGSHGQRSER